MKLHCHHVKVIENYWRKKYASSYSIILDCIKYNTVVGLFLDGDNPKSWAVQTHYGGIGMAYTLEEYRRRGYATAVVKTMINTLYKEHNNPFVLVRNSNIQALHLFRKVQFQDICKVTWLLTKKKKSKHLPH